MRVAVKSVRVAKARLSGSKTRFMGKYSRFVKGSEVAFGVLLALMTFLYTGRDTKQKKNGGGRKTIGSQSTRKRLGRQKL
jgi:hypothetical protein